MSKHSPILTHMITGYVLTGNVITMYLLRYGVKKKMPNTAMDRSLRPGHLRRWAGKNSYHSSAIW